MNEQTNKLLRFLNSQIEECKKEIEEYKSNFNNDPVDCLRWYTIAILKQCKKLERYEKVIQGLNTVDFISDGGTSIEVIYKWCTDELANRRFVNNNSSIMFNIIEQVENEVLAELVRLLQKFVEK